MGVILRFYECGVKGKMKNGGKEENVAIKRDSGTSDEKRVKNFVPWGDETYPGRGYNTFVQTVLL